MINLLFIVFILLGSFNLVNLINVLVEQYYSLNRLYKYKLSTIYSLKEYYFGLTIYFISGILLFYFKIYTLTIILFLLINYFFVIKSNLKNYHFTRRNTLLLLFSGVINGILSFIVYYQISIFMVAFALLINNVSLVVAYLLLLPIEKIIQNYYIYKAKKKVKKNNYIVIGVTGSFGKTTTKNFIYQILSNKYLISRQDHNYNTLMGICKYINNEVKDEDDILLVELGVDSLNQMKRFKKILLLDYAIISSIGEMHLSTFKNINNIIKEKLSIRDLLKKDGKIFIEEDIENKYYQYLNFSYIKYSEKELNYQGDFFYQLLYKDKKIETKLISRYQIKCLSIALKLGKEFNLSDNEILYSIFKLELPLRRCSIYYHKKMIIIDNSYNGNINAIDELINRFKSIKEKKIVITGGLIELGDKYYSTNFELGKKLSIFDHIIFVTIEENHPLIDGVIKDKLLKVNTYQEAYNLLNEIDEKCYILLLSKGSDNYLK